MSVDISDIPRQSDVIIIGAGPVGLTLALTLARHGVGSVIIERNSEPTSEPKMDITNARSMEIFKRLNVAEAIRRVAISPDSSTNVTWKLTADSEILAVFEYPSVAQLRALLRQKNDGTRPLEPYARLTQPVLERVLSDAAANTPLIKLCRGWSLAGFASDETSVKVRIEDGVSRKNLTLSGQYLAGCDGANSTVRKGLGFELDEISPVEVVFNTGGYLKSAKMLGRDLAQGDLPPDGRLLVIHFRSSDRVLNRCGWHTQFPNGGTLISQNDDDLWTLHVALRAGENVDAINPKTQLEQTLGVSLEAEIIAYNPWVPRLNLVERFGAGRVWLAGDAAHQYIPTGGYGMNSGVADAFGLGWALAGNILGWGGETLLSAYHSERHAVGRLTRKAALHHIGVRMKIVQSVTPDIFTAGHAGEQARQKLTEVIYALGNLENEADGVEWGHDYTTSPVICHDEATPESDGVEFDMATYSPIVRSGLRLPDIYLKDGRSLYEHLGEGFTLICFDASDVSECVKAAKNVALPMKHVCIQDSYARSLCQKDFILVRPDQFVAWCGDEIPKMCQPIIDHIRGVTEVKY